MPVSLLFFLIFECPGYRRSIITISGFDLEQVLEDELVEAFGDAFDGQTDAFSEQERKQRSEALGECLELIKAIRGPVADSAGDSEFLVASQSVP